MDASVKDLKAHLSTYLRRVQAGASVTVRVGRRAVARLVPVRAGRLSDLARLPGLRWSGGKPRGLARAQRMPRSVSLAQWAASDRR
jgi:antitoxin (DNA-binding transcriptional repressor) of toxin-antitoxin stability system